MAHAANVVFATNSTRQANALLSGFNLDPAYPPSLLPGMPATNTQRKATPICDALISRTCIM
jgi:hypothetical protein